MHNTIKCSVESCSRDIKARGLCGLHYGRQRKGVDLNAPARGALKLCQVDGCDRKVSCKGVCGAHYQRKKFNKSSLAPITLREPGMPCVVDGCDKDRAGRKMCQMHYAVAVRKERYEFILEKIGDFCKSCNIKYPIAAYDFHHIDPNSKLFAISSNIAGHSMDAILKEVDKCVLLCANCHRIHHNNNSVKQ